MKKNLIILMADQLRYDVISSKLTPNIWAIKKEGISFENAHTACPLCVPSRGAFFTGTYPNNNGSLINPWVQEDKKFGDVKCGIDNLYQMMCKSWCVIHSGKQHLFTEGGKLEDKPYFGVDFVSTEASYLKYLEDNGKKRPGGPKFKTYVPEMVSGTSTRAARYSNPRTGVYEGGEEFFFDSYFTKKTIEALKNRDKSKPLFLSQMFVSPHPPLEIPQRWFDKFKLEDVDMPENVAKFYKYQSPLQLYNLTGAIGTSYSKEEWRESWRVYLGLVSYLDYLVGIIINELKEEGIYDDSMIIFTSDHGEMLGSHYLYQKMCMYEESSKVPLFIKFPKDYCKNASKEYFNNVSLIDVVPTLQEYLDFNSSNSFDGISLMKLIENGDSNTPQRPIFMQYDGNGSRSNFQRSVIDGKYKLIIDLFKDEYYLELYDIELDRQETENLIFTSSQYDEKCLKMISLLRNHMNATGDLISLGKININEFRGKYENIGAKMP